MSKQIVCHLIIECQDIYDYLLRIKNMLAINCLTRQVAVITVKQKHIINVKQEVYHRTIKN